MGQNSRDSHGYKLESQLREAYGRIVYTQTCHNKIVDRLHTINDTIKIGQIVLSAITTGTFLITILSNEKVSGIIGAIFSVLLLMLNTYVKNTALLEDAHKHQQTANLLWEIREDYVSLLVDFEILDDIAVMQKRDELQKRTADIYAHSPKTDARSYKKAQKALKFNEEQTFSDDEIDILLSTSIRRNKRNTEIKVDSIND